MVLGLGEADTQHVAHSVCLDRWSWAVRPPALYVHALRVVRHPDPLSARTAAPDGKVGAAWSGPDFDETVGSMFPQPCGVLPVLPSVLYLPPAWSGVFPKQNFRDIKGAGPQCVQAMSRMVQVLLRACRRACVRVRHRQACVCVYVCVCACGQCVVSSFTPLLWVPQRAGQSVSHREMRLRWAPSAMAAPASARALRNSRYFAGDLRRLLPPMGMVQRSSM